MSHPIISSKSTPNWSRRDWLTTAVAATVLSNFPRQAAAQEGAVAPLNRFPRMVHEYFVTQVGLAVDQSRGEYLKLETRDDALQHVEAVRKKVATAFGPLPHRTPLNARITGKLASLMKREGRATGLATMCVGGG